MFETGRGNYHCSRHETGDITEIQVLLSCNVCNLQLLALGANPKILVQVGFGTNRPVISQIGCKPKFTLKI